MLLFAIELVCAVGHGGRIDDVESAMTHEVERLSNCRLHTETGEFPAAEHEAWGSSLEQICREQAVRSR